MTQVFGGERVGYPSLALGNRHCLSRKSIPRCARNGFWRREWDSNPRYVAVRRFSKPLPSAARPSLHGVDGLMLSVRGVFARRERRRLLRSRVPLHPAFAENAGHVCRNPCRLRPMGFVVELTGTPSLALGSFRRPPSSQPMSLALHGFRGGAYGVRTRDLYAASVALSQLS